MKATSAKIVSLLAVILTFNSLTMGQEVKECPEQKSEFFIDVYAGTQVSGIRKEDYVASNYSPYIQISGGAWIVPNIALAAGYQGPYFNFIGDEFKHNYTYLCGEVIIKPLKLFNLNKSNLWNLHFNVGGGYFYNHLYERPNICAHTGFINEIQLPKNFSLKLKISAIIGWDIYQGDKDVLPNIAIGFSKNFSYLFQTL